YRPPGIERAGVYRMLRDREGSLWIGSSGGDGLFHVHDGRTDRFQQLNGLSSDSVLSVFEDREGSMWVSTSGGLDRFRPFAVTTYSLGQGLPDPVVWSVLAGTDGSIWFGTGKGLNRWNTGHLTRYNGRRAGPTTGTAKTVPAGLPDDIVESLLQDVR